MYGVFMDYILEIEPYEAFSLYDDDPPSSLLDRICQRKLTSGSFHPIKHLLQPITFTLTGTYRPLRLRLLFQLAASHAVRAKHTK